MKGQSNYFLTGIICLVFSLNTQAQNIEKYISHPDTLRIDLSDGQSISFAFKDIKKSQFDVEFISKWTQAIEKTQTILNLETYTNLVSVTLTNRIIENELKDVIEVKPYSKKTNVYISRNGQVQNISNLNQIIFEINNISVRIRLTELENLSVLKNLSLGNLQQKLQKQKEAFFFDSRKVYYLSTTYEKVSFSDFEITDSGTDDFIELTGGIGVGLFRDKLAPEFSLKTMITFRDKHGIRLHKFGVQSTFHYMFDRTADNSYDMNINTFLTAFYKHNFSKSTLKDRWAGVGVGYLVKNSGNYFGENTFKVGLFLNAQQSSIDIIPEIIITDNFKTVFPSIRFGLTF